MQLYESGYTSLKKTPPENVVKLKAHFISAFQDKKRTFDFAVIALIQWCIPSIDEPLMNHMLELEDGFANKIDSFKSPNNLEFEFRTELLAHKAKLYILLHERLKNPTDSKFKFAFYSVSQFFKSFAFVIKSFFIKLGVALKQVFNKKSKLN